MSQSPAPAPTSDDILNVLPQFTALLQSARIDIPPLTLLGAITHFLSQLDSAHLEGFITVLLQSPSIWSQDNISKQDLREAVRLAVPARIAKITEQTKDVYFADIRRRRKAREWLDTLLRSLHDEENNSGTLNICIALLSGISETPEIDWGKGRFKLEEIVVLELAEKLDSGDLTDLSGIASVIPHIGIERLQAFDMEKLSDHIEKQLYSTIDQNPPSSEGGSSDYAQALARSFEVLDYGGPSSQQHCRMRMIKFCEEVRERAEDLEKQWERRGTSDETHGTPVWDKSKETFFCFLIVASTILDTLLAEDRTGTFSNINSAIEIPENIPVELLITLGSFSFLVDASQGGFDNYHKILYGALDILSSRGGPEGVRKFFDRLQTAREWTDTRAGYALVLADELIHLLGKKEIDMLLPLAERHVSRPNHKPSFEASHAFLLSLLRSSMEDMGYHGPQTSFFDALLPNYLNILTKQFIQKNITSEQFSQAFPIVVESASKRPEASVKLCLSYLSQLPATTDIRHCQIAVTPYIDSADLPIYLEDLAQIILSTEKGSQDRMDLTKSAFEMVVRDLSDTNKSTGIRWWMRWRKEFEGDERKVGFIRSRL